VKHRKKRKYYRNTILFSLLFQKHYLGCLRTFPGRQDTQVETPWQVRTVQHLQVTPLKLADYPLRHDRIGRCETAQAALRAACA
jgi:hypothetical protein